MGNIFSQYTWPAICHVFKKIISALAPEKIYLISVIHKKEKLQSIFVEASAEEYFIEALNILILSSESEKRSSDELQDIVEHGLGIQIPVTAFILPARQFNEWLKRDHPFALRVFHKATLYYDKGNMPWVVPNDYNEMSDKKLLSKELDQKTMKAAEFIAGAELFIIRKQYEIAAFHLHQAAEQIYSGIIRFVTGFHLQTHNLDKLYRYSKYLLAGLKDVFPRSVEEEKKLFQYLQNAYIGGRYNDEYRIRYAHVSQLLERVKKLLLLCQNIQKLKLITA